MAPWCVCCVCEIKLSRTVTHIHTYTQINTNTHAHTDTCTYSQARKHAYMLTHTNTHSQAITQKSKHGHTDTRKHSHTHAFAADAYKGCALQYRVIRGQSFRHQSWKKGSRDLSLEFLFYYLHSRSVSQRNMYFLMVKAVTERENVMDDLCSIQLYSNTNSLLTIIIIITMLNIRKQMV